MIACRLGGFRMSDFGFRRFAAVRQSARINQIRNPFLNRVRSSGCAAGDALVVSLVPERVCWQDRPACAVR